MSDIAPFVAATIKDKVVEDLLQENRKLREELRACRAVEITGPGGEPVYARAHYDDDGKSNGNPNLWDIRFPEEQRDMAPCNLANLLHAEIRVGSVVRKVFGGQDEYNASVRRSAQVHEQTPEGRGLDFCFTPGDTWCSIFLKNWPQEDWVALQREEAEYEDNGNGAFFDAEILERESQALPDVTVSFRLVTLSIETATVIKSLPQYNEEEAVKGREISERRDALLEAVGDILTNSGRGGGTDKFFKRNLTVVNVLMRNGIEETGSHFDAVIDRVIDLVIERLENEDEEGEEDC